MESLHMGVRSFAGDKHTTVGHLTRGSTGVDRYGRACRPPSFARVEGPLEAA